MTLRRANLQSALRHVGFFGAAALLACATIFGSSGAAGLNSPRSPSENEERTEIDGSHLARAAVQPTRRCLRSKLHPGECAGIILGRKYLSCVSPRRNFSQLQPQPSADGWTLPLRL